MPELPEVETLKLGLQKYIVGKTIKDVDIKDPKLFEGDSKKAVGSKVVGVRRLAKGVLIDLSNDYTFAIHIKLTGQLIFRDKTNQDLPVQKPVPLKVPNQFTRVVITFVDPHPNPLPVGEGTRKGTLLSRPEGEGIDEGEGNNKKTSSPATAGEDGGEGDSFLYFQEVRGFAWMKLLPTEEIQNIPFFKTLGPDFIPSEDSGRARMTESELEEIVTKSNLPIKVLLMEQKKIGGIGNIYANDGLFDAGIDPRRRAKSLTVDEIKTLYNSLMKVLVKAMKYRGSSELNFVDVLGQLGEYQKHFLIYGKKGKVCERCGGTVEKVYLAGRGTFFCTGCQK